MVLEALLRKGFGGFGTKSFQSSPPKCHFCLPGQKLVPWVVPKSIKSGWKCPHCDAKFTTATSGNIEPWDPSEYFDPAKSQSQKWGLSFQNGTTYPRYSIQDENTPINPKPTQRTCIELEAGKMVFDGNILCRTCSHHQTLIIQLLAAFEQDHLDANAFAEKARDYQADLDKRYPLCPTCDARVKQRLDQVAYKLQTRRLASARSHVSSLKTGKFTETCASSGTVLVWEVAVQIFWIVATTFNESINSFLNLKISDFFAPALLAFMMMSIFIVRLSIKKILGLLLLYALRIVSTLLFVENHILFSQVALLVSLIFFLFRSRKVKVLFAKPKEEYFLNHSLQNTAPASKDHPQNYRSPFSPAVSNSRPLLKPPSAPIHLRPTSFDVSRPTGIEKVLESFSIGGDDEPRQSHTSRSPPIRHLKPVGVGRKYARIIYQTIPQVLFTGLLLLGRVVIEEEWTWKTMMQYNPSSSTSSSLLVSSIIILATCLGFRGFLWPKLNGTLCNFVSFLTVMRLANFAVLAFCQHNSLVNSYFQFMATLPNLGWFLIDTIVILSR